MDNPWLATALITLSVGIVAFFSGREVHRRRTREATQAAEKGPQRRPHRGATHAVTGRRRGQGTCRELPRARVEVLEHRRVEVQSPRRSDGIARIDSRAAGHQPGTTRGAHLLQVKRKLPKLSRRPSPPRRRPDRNLERLAGFDAQAAKEELLQKVEDEGRREAMVLMRDLEMKAREEADRRARRVLATAYSAWLPRSFPHNGVGCPAAF